MISIPFPMLNAAVVRRIAFTLSLALFLSAAAARANLPGGGAGTGPAVTVTDHGDTVTLANGIVSIVIVKSSARLNAIDYTYNNNGTPRTSPTLKGPGQYYYGGFSLGSGQFTCSVGTDPAGNGGNYGDVKLVSDSPTHGIIEVHFSMLRGSPGFYSTATETHRPQDDPMSVSAWGVVTRVPGDFNWLSADDTRNFLIGTPTTKGVMIPNAPHEITVNLDGSKQGEFADKFIYGQDHADLRAWGWSSVGQGGLNIGRWIMTTMDFSNGGPMKRDVSCYPYSELNNSILTGELGMGSDGNFAKGEVWTKTCGPWFMYVNNVPASITDPATAARMLYQDAQAQAAAEKAAWPYAWFKDPHYPPAAGRGTVRGTLVIQDAGNPNASNAGIWVGLEEQPITGNGTYDFQKWFKPYQYWVQTDAQGNFDIPNVLPGDNYTLWAYGPGAAGTFLSQNQQGNNPKLECDVPAAPFAVRAAAGSVTELGAVKWTPMRVGPTVFELGYPNRKADKFRHGEDYSFPDLSPKLGFPTPVWGAQMEFPVDFPNGLTYTVGRSRWSTDWNFILPSLPNLQGLYQPCTGTIRFNLAQTPAAGAAASIYIAAAGDDGGKIFVSVNGSDLDSAPGAQGAPDALSPEGYDPPYFDDSSIHFGVHGPFSDERINFPGSLLHAGANTITVQMSARSMVDYLMIDYLRLELAGYIPPAPASVTAFAGNNRTLVTWPVVAGATGYDVLRSTSAASGYAPILTNKKGIAAGNDALNLTYMDTTATNGTPYYYQVVSINPVGKSLPSPASAPVIPQATLPAGIPSAPAGLQITRSAHHEVDLAWNASPGANYYRIWRTTLHSDGVGHYYPLRTIMLNDLNPAPAFTDTTPTDGKTYSYCVQAVDAAGASGPSAFVQCVPLPQPPASSPGPLAGKWVKAGRQGEAIVLNWTPVPGAVGYVIYRSSQDGQFKWPENFVTTIVETTYTDANKAKRKNQKDDTHMNTGQDYYYQVTAVNAGGVSPSVSTHVGPLAE